MAEQRGFEPPQPCDPNDLANRPLQPLEYCSKSWQSDARIMYNRSNNAFLITKIKTFCLVG